jgi:RimJ/RimL family protein N-acetyltransferase|tara:strand:- start:15824 stop:16357 length:534 start_codon:yes stop_codon:yes gene_type:complete
MGPMKKIVHQNFETQRLFIRPTSEEDADLIFQLMNAPKFLKFVGDRRIYSIPDALKYIQTNMLPQLYNLGYSNYSLIEKISGDKIGICGIYDRDGLDGVDIGFGLLPKYERFGYAYEASSRLIKAGFEEFHIQEIKAIVSKQNISSQRLLEKLGFESCGLIKLPNEKVEELLFRITK